MEYLLGFVAIGLIVPAVLFIIFPHNFTWKEFLTHVLVILVFMWLGWVFGTFTQTVDSATHNGKILSKDRQHGSYVESYSCNCRTSNNIRTCSTCYRTHYTVKWFAQTTIGNVTLDYKDWTSSAVYSLPDPKVYIDCEIGDTASVAKGFTNYTQAVNVSLLSMFSGNEEIKLERKNLPKYPRPHNVYKFDRVTGDEFPTLEADLNDRVGEYGENGANPIVIILRDKESKYRYVVERLWKGGKINDVVILISLDASNNIQWADAFTYGNTYKNQTVVVELRNFIKDLETLTAEKELELSKLIDDTLTKNYELTTSKDFEYLKHEISPGPITQIVLLILAILTSSGLGLYFFNNDPFF